MQDQNNELLFKTAYKILPELKIHVKIHVYFGNKAKGESQNGCYKITKCPNILKSEHLACFVFL